jgi:hypothetical protein
MPATYSIKLDVLRALVAERHARILSQIDAEPDAARIAALEQEMHALPTWGTYPDEDRIDAVIDDWRAVIAEQRAG